MSQILPKSKKLLKVRRATRNVGRATLHVARVGSRGAYLETGLLLLGDLGDFGSHFGSPVEFEGDPKITFLAIMLEKNGKMRSRRRSGKKYEKLMKNCFKSRSRECLGRSWSDPGGPGVVSGVIWGKNLEKRSKKGQKDSVQETNCLPDPNHLSSLPSLSPPSIRPILKKYFSFLKASELWQEMVIQF